MGVEFVNCRSCKKLFAKYYVSYCKECEPIEDAHYRNVRDFLYKNPYSDVAKVSEGTGVDHPRIFEYIEEGRVTVVCPSQIPFDKRKQGCEVIGEAANCRRCKKIFQKIRDSFCPACIDAEEAIFATVKEFLYAHPNSNVQQIAKGTGVSATRILAYMKEGRIG